MNAVGVASKGWRSLERVHPVIGTRAGARELQFPFDNGRAAALAAAGDEVGTLFRVGGSVGAIGNAA
jgi:hypothetical protein